MKGMQLGFSLCLAVAGVSPACLHADTTTVIYTFANATTSSGTIDPTQVPVADGVLCGPFSAAGYTGDPSASGRFSWVANPTGAINGDDNFADFTGALDSRRYFEVTLAPDASFNLNVDRITFDVRRSSTGIRNYAVRSSLDDFAGNLPGVVSPPNSNLGTSTDNSFQWLFDAASTSKDQLGSEVDLGSDFDGLTGPITFRFYGWNAESAAGSFSIDNVTFSLCSNRVPEPAAAELFVVAGLALALWRTHGLRRATSPRAC